MLKTFNTCRFNIGYYFFQEYANASQRKDLEETLLLLSMSAILVENFTDLRPIRSLSDQRMLDNQKVLDYLVEWRNQKDVNPRTNFITRESYEDLVSMLTGFQKLVEIKLHLHPVGYIVPGRVNTDVVENFFCSQRGINGANNNPSYLQYTKGINTILISRKIISTKSNAGGTVVLSGALPFKIHSGKSFKNLRV